MGVALAVLHELLVVEPEESAVSALGSFVLELGESLGIEPLRLIGQPHRIRDMLCYVDRPRRAGQEDGDSNTGVLTDAERAKLRACIDSSSIRPTSLSDCISWKHVTTFSFASLRAAVAHEGDDDDDEGDFARVRGMRREWIPMRHLAEVLSCTPPLEWDLHGTAVCAYLALRS
jgi:hypothetical protein